MRSRLLLRFLHREMPYGFTSNLRDAFSNALFIGFSGTPIEKTGANTQEVFGDYI
jgi:type I restriction enzyme R subunit